MENQSISFLATLMACTSALPTSLLPSILVPVCCLLLDYLTLIASLSLDNWLICPFFAPKHRGKKSRAYRTLQENTTIPHTRPLAIYRFSSCNMSAIIPSLLHKYICILEGAIKESRGFKISNKVDIACVQSMIEQAL